MEVVYTGPNPTLIGPRALEDTVSVAGSVPDRYLGGIERYQELIGNPRERVLNPERIEKLGKTPVEVSLDNGMTVRAPICYIEPK